MPLPCFPTGLFYYAAASVVGLAVSTAHPAGIAASVLMPALALRQKTRWESFYTAAAYYASAIWAIMPGARNFFGSQVSVLSALMLWAIPTVALAIPWAAFWSSGR